MADLILSLRCLGQATLLAGTDESERLILPTGKPLALLTFLTCAPSRSATRDELIDLLWSNVEREYARHTLRQTLWYIKRRMGADPFATHRNTLSLAIDLPSDRAAFLAALEIGDPATAISHYNGDFLPGFAAPGGVAFEQWADAERSRLRALYLHATETESWQETHHSGATAQVR
jgi:DNA-binding SARP family transcriptional activator